NGSTHIEIEKWNDCVCPFQEQMPAQSANHPVDHDRCSTIAYQMDHVNSFERQDYRPPLKGKGYVNSAAYENSSAEKYCGKTIPPGAHSGRGKAGTFGSDCCANLNKGCLSNIDCWRGYFILHRKVKLLHDIYPRK